MGCIARRQRVSDATRRHAKRCDTYLFYLALRGSAVWWWLASSSRDGFVRKDREMSWRPLPAAATAAVAANASLKWM